MKEQAVPNAQDAVIKLLTPVDDGTNFTIDLLPLAAGYDVVADVEIGATLVQTATQQSLHVAVVNLTTATQVQLKDVTVPIPSTPSGSPFRGTIKVDFDPVSASGAVSGDVLQAVASYKVTANSSTDVSAAQSVTFVVE
jgi:hypothetical protein